MKSPFSLWLVTCLLITHPHPALSLLVGFGLNPSDMYCGSACQMALQTYRLTCSNAHQGGASIFSAWVTTSPECKANNTAYLTTFAWCLHVKCENGYRVSELEGFWERQATKDLIQFQNKSLPLAPKWTYRETLLQIKEPPTRMLTPKDVLLNFTALVPEAAYQKQFNTGLGVQREQVLGATYGIIILVIGFGLPILLTWTSYLLPFGHRVTQRLAPYLTYPSTIGTFSVRPLPFLLGNAPTVGQAVYVLLFFALNVVLCSIHYQSLQPHAYYKSESDEIKAYIFYRTGIVGYALVPLLILFSSRNNVLLLWLTNWSHATYLVLHRWVARLFVLHALVHSFLALPLFLPNQSVVETGYWDWGTVATVFAVVILGASVLPVRRWSYEIFLATHVVFSVILMIGLWYHVYLWVGLDTWGYESWIYAACAVWFFDRAARAGRVLKNGMKRSRVVDLGGGYVRVDVPDVAFANDGPGLHVYAHFPTLSLWRSWENHPFSVVPTVLMIAKGNSGEGSSGNLTPTATAKEEGVVQVDVVDVEKHQQTGRAEKTGLKNLGITLLIKKSTGITKYLEANEGLLTLLDGPYHSTPNREVRRCDRLLLIGGGIGITTLLPWVTNHPNVKLCWSVKESARCLVEEVEGVLSDVESDVRVGTRLDVVALLANEAESGYKKIGVVVSGPGGLCDDARAAVVAAGRKGDAVFELEVDAYSW